jgi:hypothetical protein
MVDFGIGGDEPFGSATYILVTGMRDLNVYSSSTYKVGT